jgi:hypothetical protein
MTFMWFRAHCIYFVHTVVYVYGVTASTNNFRFARPLPCLLAYLVTCVLLKPTSLIVICWSFPLSPPTLQSPPASHSHLHNITMITCCLPVIAAQSHVNQHHTSSTARSHVNQQCNAPADAQFLWLMSCEDAIVCTSLAKFIFDGLQICQNK